MNHNIREAVRCARHSEHYDVMYLAQAVGELLEHQNTPRLGAVLGQSLRKQQEQEPVAWSYWQSCLNDDGTQTAPWVHRFSKFKPSESIINKDIVPLYTTPPQRKWVGLTDEEIMEPWPFPTRIEFARAIEAKLKEKNT
jgi:hypothetical protein